MRPNLFDIIIRNIQVLSVHQLPAQTSSIINQHQELGIKRSRNKKLWTLQSWVFFTTDVGIDSK